MAAQRWADWRAPGPAPSSVVLLTGPSCKAWALVTCDEIHGRGFRADTVCVCGKCHATGRLTESRIAHSKAQAVADPEDRLIQLRKGLEEARDEPERQALIQATIDRLQALVDSWAATPTSYDPDPALRGGIG